MSWTRLTVGAMAGAIAACAAVGTPSASEAQTTPQRRAYYYVDSVRGRDRNTGRSARKAWKTLGRAVRADLRPGDRLLLRRGSRFSGSVTVTASGTARAPIVISAYGASGNAPLVRGGVACLVLSGSHVIVFGLHLDGCSWAGVQVAGDRDLIEHSTISDNAAGVQVRTSADGTQVMHNEFRDNNKMSVLTREPTHDDSGAFGVLINGTDTEVGYNTIAGSDAFSYDYGRDGAAVEIFGGQRSWIHHNLAVDNNSFTELGGAGASDNTYAWNVVRSSLDSSEFLVTRGSGSRFGPVLRTSAYNNSVYLSGASSAGIYCSPGCAPDILSLTNDIVVAMRYVGWTDHPFDDRSNLYWGGQLRFTKGRSSLVANPLFVDPAEGDLHLRPGSPAIDAGVDLGMGLDFDGNPVPADGNGDGLAETDIGAYEYSGAA